MKRPTNFRLDDERLDAWREEAERSGQDLTAFIEAATDAVTATEARRAHGAVARALADGQLVKGPCEVCGVEKSEGHHDDYAKPLEVRWLCRAHHRAWHRLHPSGVNWEIIPVRVDDESKERWQAAAAERDMNLSEFIRLAVEEKIERAAEPDAPVVPRPPVVLGRPVPSSGKRSYAADPKGGKAKK